MTYKISNDNALLSILIEDQKSQADDLYKPGPYWSKYSTRICQEIKKSDIQNFRSNVNIGKGYADIINKDPFELVKNPGNLKEKIISKIPNLPIIKRYVTSNYLQYIESYLSSMLSYRSKYYSLIYGSIIKDFTSRLETIDYCIGNPNNVISYDGHKIGKSYFDAILRLSGFEKKINFDQGNALFEIGGGFGSTTNLIIRLYSNIKKIVYLDIPPNLYIGTQYLKSIYGEAVRDYKETRTLAEIRFSKSINELEIVTIAPWQLPRLKVEVDLFYNSASFQEMPLAIIQNYSKHINRLMTGKSKNVCLWFYKHTDVLNTVSPDLIKSELSQELNLVIKELQPGFINEDDSIWMYGATNEKG
ncbi:putative sugar O-methyltransferase [Leptospira weilii]|uniref:putative sugar O-methyltransferase n=1 Tax=Leptospira weilii TaxID=28184 RepID=UPI00256F5A07|nr:putative sugar O-methyltransferase [Leptospira weilii]MDL5246317.1 putative sugar O-methyltransferase [Leptospira weilii]